MDRRRAAAALLALAACFACSAAAPTASNQTALDLYEGAPEGCYYNFQHYGEGDRIMTNEPCLNCTCHNRMLMCYLRVCPFTKAIGQDCTVEKRADQCCPIVTCPDVPVDLLTSTSTTSPAEYGATGLGKLDKYGCSINGKYFPEGSKVPPTPNKPCEHCYCIRNMTTCVMQECTLHVDGCTPIYHKDVCCPIRYSCDHPEDEVPLLDDMSTTVRPTPGFLLTTTTISPVTQMTQDCVHDEQIFSDGALIKTEKACEHCYCMKGDIVCVVQECGAPMENEGKNCTSLLPREGQCCPDTYICEGDELSSEVPTESTSELIIEKLTTLSPPRRAGDEGSGYRNEPDEAPYTEIPTVEPEVEGSGDDQETSKPFGPEEIMPTSEDGDQYIYVTTKAPASEYEDDQKTTEMNKNIPDLEDKYGEPHVYSSTTNAPVREEADKLTTSRIMEHKTSEPHEHPTTSAPERVTTDLVEALNTVPDVIPEEEITKPHELAPTTTSAPLKPAEEIKPTSPAQDVSITAHPDNVEPEYSTSKPSTSDELEKETTTSTETLYSTSGLIPEKEYSEGDSNTIGTTSAVATEESESPVTQDGAAEKDSSQPEYFASSTSSISADSEKVTTEPDHALNTIAVAEDENIHTYSHITTTTVRLPSDEEERTTVTNLEQNIVTDGDVPHENAPTKAPALENNEFITAEPDRGLNTIPSENNEETSSEPSPGRTTLIVETKATEPTITTDKIQTQEVDIESTAAIETVTLVPENISTKGDQYTITTEPSFRKEDESNVYTEKPKELTTVKSEFVDEGLIPTSPHDEKFDTSSDVPLTEEDITTIIPEYTKEIAETIGSKQTTTESILEPSVVTESLPGKVSEPSTEQESELTSSTEKFVDVTTSVQENIVTEEPSRIPGEGDCLLNGVTYRNNSVVPSTNNCHTGCRCASSIIKCDPIICSPPPDYMDNCQSIYDSPDACCPTYVCDHPRETVPPQSDNQMSGTESPIPSVTIKCRGDQCEISESAKQPTEASEPCTSGTCSNEYDHKPELECGSEGCKNILDKPDSSLPTVQKAEECTDGKCKPESCANGECQLPQTETQVSPVKPCEDEHCKDISIPSPPHCQNEEECKSSKIPVVQATPCEGESCKNKDCGDGGCGSDVVTSPQETIPTSCKEEGGCKPDIIPVPDCTGDEPCRRKDISAGDEKLPTKCEGNNCKHETEPTDAQGIAHESTVSPSEQTTFKEVTEKVSDGAYEEKATEVPETHISTAKIPVEDKMENYTTELQTDTAVTEADVEKEKPTIEDVVTKKPVQEEGTETPALIYEEEKEKPVEVTDKPMMIEKEGTEAPVMIDASTDEPTQVGEEDEEKPAIVKEKTTENPAVGGEEGTEEPTVIEKEGTEKPFVVEKGVTEKPIIIDEEHSIDDERSTKQPDLDKEEETKKPVTEGTTTKTSIYEEESGDKPVTTQEESTKEPSAIEKEGTEIPSGVEEDGTVKPTIIEKEDTSKPAAIDEGTEKPLMVDELHKEKPTDKNKPVEDNATEIPVPIENEGTDKPAIIKEDGEEKPDVTAEPVVIDVRDKERPTGSEEESTEKVTVVVEKDTEKPVDIDEYGKERPGITSEEGTEKPVVEENYKTEKPDTVDEEVTESVGEHKEESTAKPTLIDQEKSSEPTTIEVTSTVKPTIIDEDGKYDRPSVDKETKKPAVIEKESTELPAVIGAEDTEKPLIDEEGTENPPGDESIKPSTVVVEGTKKPVGIDEESTPKPSITEKEKESTEEPTTVEREHTKKPTVIERESTELPATIGEDKTEKPAVTDDESKENPILVNKESTKKPLINEDKKEPGLADDGSTGEDTNKPTIFEKEGTEFPSFIDDMGTDKPLVDEEGKLKPSTDEEDIKKSTPVEEESTDKPLVDEEGKLKPSVDDEDIKKSTPVEQKSTEKPLVNEEGILKPSVDDKDIKKSTPVEQESTDKPHVDEEGKLKPSTDEEDIKTSTPAVEQESTDKPLVDEEGKLKPSVDDEDIKISTPVEQESTDKPYVDEEGKLKPSTDDEDIKKSTPAVEQESTDKPLVDEEEKLKPSVDDKDIKKPTPVEQESTDKPYVDEEGKLKPSVDDEDIRKPTPVEQESTEKTWLDGEGKLKPSFEDEDIKKTTPDKQESTKKPGMTEVERTEKTPTQDEEGSGTEMPEMLTAEPEIYTTDSTISELEKKTKTPAYESQTTPVATVEQTYTTESTTFKIVEGSTSPQEMLSSETPEIKVTESEDGNSDVTVILDNSRTPETTTESLTEPVSFTKIPLSTTTAEEVTTSVPEKEKETVTEQNVQVTSPKADSTDIKKEYTTIQPVGIIDEAELSTKAPELYGTSESVEKITEKGSITEIEGIYTERSDLESPTIKMPATGPVIIEPQEGIETQKPEHSVTAKTEEESTTKLYEEEKVKPVPESHKTEVTSASPDLSETSDRVPEIIDDDKSKPEEPELHVTDPEKMAAELPVEVVKEEMKTDLPEIHSPDQEETVTVTPEYTVTEPVRRFTEIEDPFVTGQEVVTPGHPEESTEYSTPSAMEKIDENVHLLTSSEKPLPTDTESTEIHKETQTSDKPVTGEQDQEQSTQPSGTEKEKPDISELPATEIPISVVTESHESSHIPEKDVTSYDEKATSVSDLSDHTQKGTTLSQELTEGLEASTEIPQHATEAQETSTKSGQEEIVITTEVTKTSVKEEDIETEEPPYTETYLGENEPFVTEKQKLSTELPTTVDVETVTQGAQVTSKGPQSLVTEHQEAIEKETTVASAPNEGPSHKPESSVTQIEEITKAPEVNAPAQEEIRTKPPSYVTESVEVSTKGIEPELIEHEDKITKVSDETATEKQSTATTMREPPAVSQDIVTIRPETDTELPELTTVKQIEEVVKSTDHTSEQTEFSETTPYLIELEEHTHMVVNDITTAPPSLEELSHKDEKYPSTVSPFDEKPTTEHSEAGKDPQASELTTKTDEKVETATKEAEVTSRPIQESSPEDVSEKITESAPVDHTTPALQDLDNAYGGDHKEYTTSAPAQITEEPTPTVFSDSEKVPISESGIATPPEKDIASTEKPLHPIEITAPEDEFIFSTTKATTVRQEDDLLTPSSDDKYVKPEEKPSETSESTPSSTTTEVPKPGGLDMQQTDEIPSPEDDGHFPSTGTSGYGEPDYAEEDQAFGPGTCRYGGKVYVSAQQIPRDDPCDFCFCFRSDIICLQQSCPPPIHGCHEEPIQGFCCPRYECPVSMATTVNVTTTTTTTTTTLPPHFPTHSYKGAAQRRGCHIKGHTYKVGEVVRSSSGPCLHCTCGGDGQMKCDPKACTPEPMLRQMIAAAVSAKRRR